FGFAAAAVAGFVLTAVPNWTGRLPLQGGPLLFLVALWLAGRAAVITSAIIGGWTAAVVDVTFLAVLLTAVAREIVAGRNWRNLSIVAALAFLCGSNVAFHIGALIPSFVKADSGDRRGFLLRLVVIPSCPVHRVRRGQRWQRRWS
ncbi:MAG TPA: NnrS family protein, partial [Candidatus Baltobacteraceae bacterium]|nr:NnrS family protein [Candidatus Baltobacteraceae bacterium]